MNFCFFTIFRISGFRLRFQDFLYRFSDSLMKTGPYSYIVLFNFLLLFLGFICWPNRGSPVNHNFICYICTNYTVCVISFIVSTKNDLFTLYQITQYTNNIVSTYAILTKNLIFTQMAACLEYFFL